MAFTLLFRDTLIQQKNLNISAIFQAFRSCHTILKSWKYVDSENMRGYWRHFHLEKPSGLDISEIDVLTPKKVQICLS